MTEIAAIEAIVAHELDAPPTDVTVVLSLDDRVVVRAVVDSRPVYFKATTDPVDLEAWACERARASGVPAPEVLVLDMSRRRFPLPFLVVGGVGGEELAGVDAVDPSFDSLIGQVAGLMRSLHAEAFEGFGLVDLSYFRATGVARGAHARWSDHLREQVEGDLSALEPAGIVPRNQAAKLRIVVEEVGRQLDPIVSARHLHGDLGSEHVHVDRRTCTVVGVIDFADVLLGDPAFDLIRFDLWHDDYEHRRSALIDAYAPGDRVTESMQLARDLYTAIQFAGNARFALQRAGDARAHNTSGLAEVLDRVT